MSPILVRPVREQLEHDRVIRLLQAKYKRKFEVAINPGHEQTAPIGAPNAPWYPDLVLQSTDRGHKLLGVVEVETAESVNNLEAMSQWATFARQRAAFHLYVPVSCIDSARRLYTDLQIPVAEFWAYHAVGDQMRFTLVQRSGPAVDGKAKAAAAAEAGRERTAKPARPLQATASKRAGSSPRTPGSGRHRAARPPAPPPRRGKATKSAPVKSSSKAKPVLRRAAAAKSGTSRKAASSSRAQKRR